MATATAIPLDGPVSASIGSSTDIDYYEITVPAGGKVLRLQTFDSTGTTCGGIDPWVDVYDTGPALVGGDDDSGPGFCDDATVILAEGTYYVEVGGWSPSTFEYVLDLTTSAIPSLTAETEANDTIATANGPFSADARIGGAISPAGDLDYYAVQNTTASPLQVHFETYTSAGLCSGADTAMFVLSAAGAGLASDDDSGLDFCSAITYTIPAYTTVYVEVESAFVAGTIGVYELLIDFH